MTEREWALLICAGSPVWLIMLFYYGGRVIRWLDGTPWRDTK
jgi:hypothetical protein